VLGAELLPEQWGRMPILQPTGRTGIVQAVILKDNGTDDGIAWLVMRRILEI